MALNLSVLKTRALTAAVFVIGMLTGLLWNTWSFFILFSVVHFGCWFEYQKIMALIDKDYSTIASFHRYGVAIAGWCLLLYCVNPDVQVAGLSLHTIGRWGCLLFLLATVVGEVVQYRTLNIKNIGRSAVGLLYISVPLALLTHLRTFLYNSPLSFADRV